MFEGILLVVPHELHVIHSHHVSKSTPLRRSISARDSSSQWSSATSVSRRIASNFRASVSVVRGASVANFTWTTPLAGSTEYSPAGLFPHVLRAPPLPLAFQDSGLNSVTDWPVQGADVFRALPVRGGCSMPPPPAKRRKPALPAGSLHQRPTRPVPAYHVAEVVEVLHLRGVQRLLRLADGVRPALDGGRRRGDVGLPTTRAVKDLFRSPVTPVVQDPGLCSRSPLRLLARLGVVNEIKVKDAVAAPEAVRD